MMWWWLAVGMNFLMLQLVVATILWLTAGAARLGGVAPSLRPGPWPWLPAPGSRCGCPDCWMNRLHSPDLARACQDVIGNGPPRRQHQQAADPDRARPAQPPAAAAWRPSATPPQRRRASAPCARSHTNRGGRSARSAPPPALSDRPLPSQAHP